VSIRLWYWFHTLFIATRVAKTLLPDILHFDPGLPASYPVNGRALADGVINVFLPILTNGKVSRENVGPHTDLLDTFPMSDRRTCFVLPNPTRPRPSDRWL
jgi:hypothetical protein